jgi:hypothetical protein
MWSASECSRKFRQMVPQAFTPRKGQNIKYYKIIQLLWRNSKYHTKTLEQALQDSFGKSVRLFDKKEAQLRPVPKVAVVTVTTGGKRTYLLANYNARKHPESRYGRYRAKSRSDEIRVWQA